MAISTARLFRTGSVPGRPRHTGQTFEFGGSPKRDPPNSNVCQIAETRRAAAEDFGFGEKLYVDFEADDRLVFRQDFRRHGRFVGNRFRHKERHIIASAGGVVRLRRGNTSPPPPRAPRTAEKLASPCADRVAGAHGEIRRQLVAAEPADLAVLPGSRFVAWPDKSCPRYAGE